MALRRPWYRVRIDGTARAIMGEPTQNESLGQLTTALDFELWDQPSLTTGMSVDLYQIEQEAETITAQFAGVVNHVAGQSSPNHVLVTCTGPLAKLRRTTPADVDLSGMTDGEAWEHVATACGISFSGADIQDAGYPLGARTPIYWRQDSPGSEVIRALDEVFGMATIEIGAGRVVRFAYDLAPDAADIYATWERSATDDYFLGERNFGDLDAIQNVWHVRGATWTDADGCQLTPWARAESTHPKLGAGVYVRSRSFSSEIIQDEALAGAVARRLMRWHNREPDEFRLEAVNDPNVVPGRVIGIVDAVYGINLASPAKPYRVTGVDRTGDRMVVRGVGGPAGAEGTVTTGVQQLCNQAEFDFDIPGSFTAPTFTLPPLLTVGAYDLDLDGFPLPEFSLPDFGVGVYTSGSGSGTGRSGEGSAPETGGGGGGGGVGQLTDWVCDTGDCSLSMLSGILLPAGAQAHYEGVDFLVDAGGQDWSIVATIELETDTECSFGLGPGTIVGFQSGVFFANDTDGFAITLDDFADPVPTFGFGAVVLTMTHDHGAGTTRFELVQGATSFDQTLAHATHTNEAFVVFATDAGEARLTDLDITIG